MNTQAQPTPVIGKARANGTPSKIDTLRKAEKAPMNLETMTNQQIVSMSTADVRANLRTLIDYSDKLLTRSAVIYALIMTTAESMTMKPVPFFVSAFSDIWPKSDKPNKDGSFDLLGLSTVELKVRDKKLTLTEAQQDAYRKVNAFSIWCRRQKEQKPEEEGAAPAAKVLPKKLVEAIAKLRALLDSARDVEVIEVIDGVETIVHEKVIPVADLQAIIEAISTL